MAHGQKKYPYGHIPKEDKSLCESTLYGLVKMGINKISYAAYSLIFFTSSFHTVAVAGRVGPGRGGSYPNIIPIA